ncbi:FAD-linked oxidase C-terminal domain-containing protein, partial [Streptomyces sp. NPDC000931]
GERAERVSGAILDLCIEHGGSITGEHGVGVDKACKMPRMFDDAALETFDLFRRAFDPDGIANPEKLLPTPRLCGERPGVRTGVHPLVESGEAEQF